VVSGLRWVGDVPEFRPKVVMAAPHPDDEVLGVAGILSWLVGHGADVVIVAVTDGTASHARSRRITPEQLTVRRIAERNDALARIGLADVPIRRLRFPDAEVTRYEHEVGDALCEHLDAETTLLVPWRRDGHPDHEAVGWAGLRASCRTGAGFFEVPIWARVRGPKCEPTHVLTLGEFQLDKRAAIRAHVSQVEPLGPDPVDGPVLHPHELEAMTSPTEWLLGVP
jgi:LmbE family N-acetylglucosaminyl deacetylase